MLRRLMFLQSSSQPRKKLTSNQRNPEILAVVRNQKKYRVFMRLRQALFRPCGIVVNMTEMFTCESLTQVFLFLLKTFCDNTDDFKRVKFVGYDRACGLVPFLINQASNGSAGAKVLLNNVKFLVDIFHVSKHTEETCMPPNNPNCKYHPSLPQFETI